MRHLLEMKELLSNSTMNFNEFIEKTTHLKDTNELDNLAILDTFPDDYLLGVYLPLVIPIVFPVAQALFFELKKKLSRK